MVDRIDPATTPAEYAAVNAASTSNYSTSSSASADAARTDSQNGGGRRRAMSVATGTPNVETVVVKAKRAASTIWTLLHAQNCVLGDRCPHTGCHEAKLLHLHIKTCAAGVGFECPTGYHGCDQARKLLAHYRRCRAIRAKQVGQAPGRRDLSRQHVCLVCSLVARQARSTLERSSTSSARSSTVSTTKKVSSRKVVSSFMLNSDNEIVPLVKKSIMPPPPPRKSIGTEHPPIKRLQFSNHQKNVELQHRLPFAVAVAGDPAASTEGSISPMLLDTSILAKSLDSVRGSYMKMAASEATHKQLGLKRSGFSATQQQPAFDLRDERKEGRPRSASFAAPIRSSQGHAFMTQPLEVQSPGRSRSASCSGIRSAAATQTASCDTILEEGSQASKESIDLDFNIDLAR